MDRTKRKITYEIEDETDKITAFRSLAVERTTKESRIKLNMYVRIYGRLRQQNYKKHVEVKKILPVTDLNELTNHLLEVLHMVQLSIKSQKKDQSSDMPDGWHS